MVDVEEHRNKHVLEYFQVTKVNVPCVQILNLSSDTRYKMPSDEITYENLVMFGTSFLNRNAKVSLSIDKFSPECQNHFSWNLVGFNHLNQEAT